MTSQEAYDEALRRILEAEKTGALELDLSGRKKGETGARYTGLETLNRLPPELERLTSLQSLDLSFCQVSDLGPLATMASLQSLDLSGCDQLSDLGPMATLSSLESLNLCYCELSDLSPLAGLTSLRSLDLFWCEQLSDLGPLAGLTSLLALNLNWCEQLSDLSPLARLTSLLALNLNGCGQLSDWSPLARLSSLHSLDLSHSEISDLSPMAGLISLQSLNLIWCKQLNDLSQLASLTSLQKLYLDECAGISRFVPLESLLPTLEHLSLFGCKLDDLPPEVCGESIIENVLNKVRAHCEDLKSGQQPDAEVKALFLGNDGAGKTQLCRRLCGLTFDPSGPSTHGVELAQTTVDLEGFLNPVHLNLWDFGGQDTYHGSHALFLQGQAVFLILWTPNLERESSYEKKGVTFRRRPLSYWLDYLRAFAGTDASVLIVQSQCDLARDRASHPPVKVDDFFFLRWLEVSAKTGLGLNLVKAALEESMRDCFERRSPPPIGAGRTKVRNRLRQMLEEDQKHVSAHRQHRLLERSEFDRISDDMGGISDKEVLLDFLHHNGVIFYRPGLFQNQIILDQNWALEAIYSIFHRDKCLKQLKKLHGRFSREDLELLIWSRYTAAEQRVFLGMMESCGICFKVRELSDDEWEYIAPELLPEWSDAQKSLLPGRIPKGHPIAEAEARYAFLHEGVLRGYLSKIGQKAGDAALYWKYGCWSYEETTDSRVLIESQWDDAESEAGAGSIRLRAWGENAERLIDPLLEALQKLPIGQRPETKRTKMISAHGRILSSASMTVRLVSASRVAQPPDIVERASSKQVDRPAQIKLEDLIFSRDPIMKDFFISYTKADQPWAEWIAWKLEDAGYSTVIQAWDFRPGTNFVLEMQQAAAEANRTIAVLSQKYLESTFTKPEWAAAFAQDPTGRQQKLIPVQIAPCDLTGILASIVYVDLVGLPEEDARAALLGAFSARNKPASTPTFPGGTKLGSSSVTPAKAFPAEGQTTSPPITQSLENLVSSTQQNRQASKLSLEERLALIRQLNAMLSQHFNMLVVTLNPEPGLIPEMPAPQADRSVALVRWAEAPGGCGLSVLQKFSRSIPDPTPSAAGQLTAAVESTPPATDHSASDLVASVTRPFETRPRAKTYRRLYDVHLIFNGQDQAEFVNWIDEALRKRGIRPWLWDRDALNFDKDEVDSIKSTPVSAIFLGQRGWGPKHRQFAQLAHDENRPAIPIILKDCSQQDREAVGDVFQVHRWIKFRSNTDIDALNELAERIVNLPYAHEAERDRAIVDETEAVKPEPSPGLRLVVYVPARSQSVSTWDSLRKKLDNEQALNGCMWYPHTYTASAWSRDGIEAYARDLDASLRSKLIEAGKDTSRRISRITLMGHSLGGVIARIAYLISAGQYKENNQGSEWWKKVDRIVLFAAPNRGIESKRFALSERLAIYSPFGRLGQIARDQLSGSEAITNLRIRWIRFFAELDSSARPAVVQLLGKGDRLVSREDSLDVEQFSQAWQYDVPGATHQDLHIVPENDSGRYNILREAILGPKPPDLQANEQTGMKKQHPVVIVLHGIRANNEDWAAQISEGIQSCASNALAISPTYRYFSMLEFALPWLRARKIRWFQDEYSSLLARYPRARFSFVGHSNGTYMLGHSLKRVPGMVFDRVTLIGSVLPREYEWDKRFALGQVEQVTNHRSSFDVPVAILCNLLRALGMRDVGTAGFDGFDQRRPEIKEVYYYNGGHGKPLEKDNLKHLIEYTLSGKADYPNAQRDRAPGKLLSRLSGSAVVGLAVAGALLVAFVLAIWLFASLLGSFLPLPPVVAWLFATLFVGVTSYLFSRYY